MARVLLLGSFAPSLVNFRGALLRGLVARGHQVFAAAPPPNDEGRVAATLADMSVTWLPIEFARNRIDPVGDLRLVRRLTKILRTHKIDRLITYTLKPNVFGAAAAALARVRSAGMVTGLGSVLLTPGRRRDVALGLMRAAGRQHEHLFVQNEDDLADLVSMGVAPRERFTRTMGSGVELDRYSPLAQPKQAAVLMLARLLVAKGVREYMRAADLLAAEFPNVPLRLAGMQDPSSGGVDIAQLQASRVEYLGALEDVRPELARCSIYALPSWHEGTPRSVLEAMACGRAIVTTQARGCRETVWPGQNGIRVPVGDARALADALASLLRDPTKCAQMGERSAQLAREHFDADKVAALIIETLGL